MKTSTIFKIQRYSIHDGPGIRTTIFFKGCPLSCWWCHNPESRKNEIELVHNKNKCVNCGKCVCQKESLDFKAKNPVNSNGCVYCGKCVDICPTESLELIGSIMSLSDVIDAIEKDVPFYDESGGGVTFSGGEPLMQFDFLKEILKSCKEREIDTAVDTCGYVPWHRLNAISKDVDIFLYDIKHMDEQKHRIYTGVSNEPILDNLCRLSKVHGNIILRMPLIPGINDDKENIGKTAMLALSLKLKSINILPYHDIGIYKYEKMGIPYKMEQICSPDLQEMESAASELKKHGLDVKIGG